MERPWRGGELRRLPGGPGGAGRALRCVAGQLRSPAACRQPPALAAGRPPRRASSQAGRAPRGRTPWTCRPCQHAGAGRQRPCLRAAPRQAATHAASSSMDGLAAHAGCQAHPGAPSANTSSWLCAMMARDAGSCFYRARPTAASVATNLRRCRWRSGLSCRSHRPPARLWPAATQSPRADNTPSPPRPSCEHVRHQPALLCTRLNASARSSSSSASQEQASRLHCSFQAVFWAEQHRVGVQAARAAQARPHGTETVDSSGLPAAAGAP